MLDKTIKIADIYIPAGRRGDIDPDHVEGMAQDILSDGQLTPIMVRWDGSRYVLVEGLHRLEACKALGEDTITAVIVQARKR
jgi:ParB-like chromosome segregation protein Spo0J